MRALPALTAEEFALFQPLVLEKSGLFFASDRAALLAEAIEQRQKQRGIEGVAEYYRLVQADPAEYSSLEELLTIGETYFFRNNYQFEAFKERVLTELKERRLFGGRCLKIWSAGSSSGEEAYTLAIILLENLPVFDEWDVSILATDINERFLDRAKEGVYSERSVAEVPPELLEKYFTKKGNKYHLVDEVKRLVKFVRHNLVTAPFDLPEMSEVDIIFCRNVIIYFNLETIRQVIDKFFQALADQGYLFLGYSETLWQISDAFSYIDLPHVFFYQKELTPRKKAPKPFVAIPEFFLEETPKPLPLVERPVPASVPPPRPSKEELRPFVRRAVELANQGEYQQAVKELGQVIEKDNLCLECYYLMGVLYEKTGELAAAIQEFKKVVYLDPRFALAYYNLANLYHYRKELNEARRAYRNAIQVLEQVPGEEPVPFTENLTADLLLAGARRGLEACENGR